MSTTMERPPLATTSETEHDGPEPEPEPLAAVQPPENPPDGEGRLRRTISRKHAGYKILRFKANMLIRGHRFAEASEKISHLLGENDGDRLVLEQLREKEKGQRLNDEEKEILKLADLRDDAVRKDQHKRPGCIIWSDDKYPCCCKICCNGGRVLMCNPDGPNCDSGKNGSCKGCSREAGCSPMRWWVYIFNRASWDFVALLVLIFVAFIGPIRFGFDRGASVGFGENFDLFVDIFFMADIVLNFFTTYRRADGKLERCFWLVAPREADTLITPTETGVTESRVEEQQEDTCTRWTQSVFADYVFGWFLPDAVASSSFIVERLSGGYDGSGKSTELMRILRLLRLAKLLRFTRIFSKLLSAISCLDEKMINNRTSLTSMIECVKALGVTLLCAHVLACLWHRAGEGGILFGEHDEGTITWTRKLGWTTLLNEADESSLDETWMLELGFDDPMDPPLWDRYLTSLYWSATTLSTVGYGDITPTTRGEQAVAMLTETLGTVLFCYLAGNIIAFVSAKRSSDLLREEKLEMVNEYLRVRNVHVELKQKVRSHFEEYYERRTVMNEPELLETMPESLRKQLVDVVYGDIVNSLDFLVQFDLEAAEDASQSAEEDLDDGNSEPPPNYHADNPRSNTKLKFQRAGRKAIGDSNSKLRDRLGGSSLNVSKLISDLIDGRKWSMAAEKHALCLALQPLPRFAANETIYREGEHSTEMYAILDGEVIGEKDSTEPRTFGETESFGLWELLGMSRDRLGGRYYTATAGANGCRVMFITQRAFADLCDEFPTLRAVASLYCKSLADHPKIHPLSSAEDLQMECPPPTKAEMIKSLQSELKGQFHLPWKKSNTPAVDGNVSEQLSELTVLVKRLAAHTDFPNNHS